MRAAVQEGFSLVGKVWPNVTTKALYEGKCVTTTVRVEVCNLLAKFFPPAEIALELLPSC